MAHLRKSASWFRYVDEICTIEDKNTVREQLFLRFSCCKSLAQVQEIHGKVFQSGLHQCPYIITKLIRTLTRLNVFALPYARAVLNGVDSPNPFLHNAVICGYLNRSSLISAIDVYKKLRMNSIAPISFTFSSLFKACGDSRNPVLASQLHAQNIFIGGFFSDVVVNNAIMNMYIKCDQVESARKMFDEMPLRDVASWTTLIVAYAKSGAMDIAKRLFDSLPKRDVIAWTTMVTGYAQNGIPREAIKHFLMMLEANINPDKISFLGFISSCAQLGTTQHSGLIDRAAKEYRGDLHIGSALVDMYSKGGNIERARHVFNEMKSKNVYTYSSMIMGLAVHGKPKEARSLFDEMVDKNIEPNEAAVVAMLAACRHAGWWRVGLEIFRKYAKVPSPVLYATMVDMIGRAGFLEEARELAEMVPAAYSSGAWGALQRACCYHGDVDLGDFATRRVLEVEDVSGNYVVLWGTYAGTGKWEEAAGVMRYMNDKNLIKDRGFSSICTDDVCVHIFQASGTCQFWNVIEGLKLNSQQFLFSHCEWS